MSKHAVVVPLLGFLLAGCVQKNEIIQPTNSSSGQFTQEILPIFNRSCNSSDCHGGGPRGFAGGLDLTSYDGIFRGSTYGTVVVSGSPFMSHLVQSINQTDTSISPISSVRMPASRDPLPAEDINTIVRWIRSGARNDDGLLPFRDPRPSGKVLFTSQYTDLVGMLDISTDLIIRYVSVGSPLPLSGVPQTPHNVAVDDSGRYYYVTLLNANKVKKYDVATNQLLGEAIVGISPAHVVITSDGSKAYVTNFTSQGKVYALNTATMTVSNIIYDPVSMRLLHGARLSHDGRYLYTADTGSDLMTVIQTSNDSIITHVPLAPDVQLPFGSSVYQPYQVAVRGDDSLIYVTLYNKGLVSVVRRSGESFSFLDTVRVGIFPIQLEVTRNRRYVYVCNSGSGSVSVIDAQTNRLSTTIPNVGKQPHGIDITEDDRLAFVTCENRLAGDPPHHPLVGSKEPGYLAVIDIASNTVIRKIEIGGYAAGVAVTPGRGN